MTSLPLLKSVAGKNTRNGVKVVYHNIVQTLLPNIDSIPTDKDYQDGWETLFNLINIYNPTTILFCGTKASDYFGFLHRNAVDNQFAIERIIKHSEKIGRTFPRSAKLKGTNNEIDLFFVRPPSSYYNWKNWHDFLKSQKKDFFVEKFSQQ